MASYAHVPCPSCGTRIPAGDMNLSAMAARCRNCHALVDLREATRAAAAPRSFENPGAVEPMPVPLPARMQVLEGGNSLTIVHLWFTFVIPLLAFFCVLWNGFLVFWYSFAVRPGTPLVFALFPLIHVAVGVGLTYFTIAGFVNRTTITVDRGHLTIRHGPLPWRGNLDMPTFNVEQLFCADKVIRNRNGTSVQYNLEAILSDGRRVRVLSNLDEREQALFIEQALEKHLGIQDRPVRSEMRR